MFAIVYRAFTLYFRHSRHSLSEVHSRVISDESLLTTYQVDRRICLLRIEGTEDKEDGLFYAEKF